MEVPAFYKQKRLTKDGKVFEILKFRSMRVDAEKYSGAVLIRQEKIRVQELQRLDALFVHADWGSNSPQLLNILKGDMSLVGPRPERPELQKEIEKEVPEFGLRLQAKAGLTGYAQVYGKYNTTFYDKLLWHVIAGSLYVSYIGTVVPKDFAIMKSIDYLIIAVLGGLGSITGTIIAAVVLGIINMFLQNVSNLRMIIYALALILVMRLSVLGGLLGTKELYLSKFFNKSKEGK